MGTCKVWKRKIAQTRPEDVTFSHKQFYCEDKGKEAPQLD